ncbi:MAG: alcohol dehydrogenase catalytic domain-containing protein, partial [Chloroflexota bacterium]|nr:alcohol dehydrogenase catalytic domain-containing protein [Chloroflexota bacterium]
IGIEEETVKALVAGDRGLEVIDQPDPRPKPQEVVVSVQSCGICGSDVHRVEAGMAQQGQIMGHEFAGTIVELGREVSGWRAGQAVAVNPLAGCGSCEMCRRGLLIRCPNMPNLGLNAHGAYAQYVAAHHSQLFALPDGMSLEEGARVEPLSVALRAIVEAHPNPGDNALVFGVGPIGLNVILGLRASRAGQIVAVGRSAGRREAAAKVGADIVLDSRETDVVQHVTDSGIPISQAYECSGDPQALLICTQAVRVGGTIAQLALGTKPASVDTRLLVNRNTHLVGSCAYGNADFGRALELIASGRVDAKQLISERVPLSEAPDAFERLRHPGSLVAILVQPWGSPVAGSR